MVAWARAAVEGPTRGKTEGVVALLAPAGAHHGTSSACGRRKLPRGGFLMEKREILWANGGFPVRWQAHLDGRP
jgi:hypothetical protein